jgi:RNA polymerase sigma-70 factor (ECF subfamily)
MMLTEEEGRLQPLDQNGVLHRAQGGDHEAFRELVECYWGPVARWLQGVTHCAHASEDLAQEVFLKAWIGLPGFRLGSHFPAWLFRIARNCWIDRQRRLPSQPPRPLPASVLAPATEPSAALEEQDNDRLLRRACDRLPEIYRTAFLLWSLSDLPYAEIADILQTTEETARWRVCKARKFLLAALGPQLDRTKP